MQKITLFSLFFIAGIAFPAALFAGGRADMVDLRIENRTGAVVETIVITNAETGVENRVFLNLERNASTTVRVERGILYAIKLIDVNDFRYKVGERRFHNDVNPIVVGRTNFAPRNPAEAARRLLFPW